MSPLRFNHMELTFPAGTLTDEFRAEVDAVFVDILGWRAVDADVVGQRTHILLPDDGQFILLAEGKKWMSSPGYDHLGFLLDTREDVDETLTALEKFATTDDRMQIKNYDDLPAGNLTVHAFYFKYLLPIWFDVQCLEYTPGTEPTEQWRYS
ncbi:MAG: hypothetical protein QOI55_1880 [Actinomycetota bacterium]|nr:hypothetical protein [Actinomycetota bacterium]